jgi:hypothetical protein
MTKEHMEGTGPSERDKRILGLPTDELANLSVEELSGNKTAITMLMHYYRTLLDDNTSLRNDLNTAQTYVSAYQTKKQLAFQGAMLLLASNVCIGFGVNLITGSGSGPTYPGWVLFAVGLGLAIMGTIFAAKEA